MVLVDTSVWIDFFRGTKKTENLSELLKRSQAILHSCILGELLLGGLANKPDIFSDISLLPRCSEYPLEEIFSFIQQEKFYGTGVGFVDVQILYSALVEGHSLWTQDAKLKILAKRYALV